MKTIQIVSIIASIQLVFLMKVYSQGSNASGLYLQNLATYSPAFTGDNDYLDIQTGFKKQWAGFEDAPQNIFISAYSPLNIQSRSTKIKDYTGGKILEAKDIKLGIGGYLWENKYGAYKQLETMLNFAAHVPVMSDTYLSLGISTGLSNDRIDLSKITIQDDINDQTYLSFTNHGSSNSFINLNTSLAIYSSQYYFSYGLTQAGQVFISGNEDVNQQKASMGHHLIGGYNYSLNSLWEFTPNAYLRLQQGEPFFFEVGLRAEYHRNLWLGTSYRNNKSLTITSGITYNDLFNLAYAFAYSFSDIDPVNSTNHEVILGIKLFNHPNKDAL